jgi:hypothetical protein
VHLATDVVDGTKIADDSIDSEHYVDGSIDAAHINTTDPVFNVQTNGNVGIGTSPDANMKLHIRRGETANIKIERAKVEHNNAQNGYVQISAAEDGGVIYCRDLDDNNKDLYIEADAVLPVTDNAYDIGSISFRWDDIYATNTTIQSSDRELKQDIEELTEAETRVAQACKGLLRKYRWKDAVAKKGDEARIHFGIIAQDLEDAFTAEGLDASRYGMFVKNTWVEGTTEVTQRGVRYSELLAFIIAAL